ncbi:MAG: O-antigen ligase family protein [Planctomycetes bacterium]|nr:O-antigen ligase family protein [Planctomycetota bacterium]
MKGAILSYVLTCVGAVGAFIDPFFGLLVYVAFAVLVPEAMWGYAMGAGNQLSRIVAIALLVSWGMRGFGRWQLGKSGGVVAALVLHFCWSVLSSVNAEDQEQARRFIVSLGKIVLPFVAGITLIDSVRQLKQLAWVIALCQGYVGFQLNEYYYSGINLVTTIGYAGMDNNSVAIAMVSCIGLAFFLGMQARRWWAKAAAFGSAACMGHVVMFGYSRGGMIALILTGFVVFLIMPKRPKHYLAFALAVLLALRLAGPEVRKRLSTVFSDPEQRDASAQSRVNLWSDCWDVMLRYPIVGVGPNHWPLIAPEYGWPLGKEAHSLWLQTGAELGVPGMLFLVTFYGLCIMRLWPIARQRYAASDPWLTDAARMVIASLVGFAVSAQFVSLEGLEVPYYITLLGAGVLKVASVRPAARDAAAVAGDR